MKAIERRQEISKRLKESQQALSASTLAKELQVSRQIIVGDVALLRAEGMAITATPRGYLMNSQKEDTRFIGRVVCQHTMDRTKAELYAIVDFGGEVLNVSVEHPLYGELSGQLNLNSRHEVDDFMERLDTVQATLLSQLTDGIHLHTIACKDQETFKKIRVALEELDVLYQSE
ncbi:3H domain-containing protein [Carnobacterium gallinarum]|uniref:transcription repressor NadR n=1 Tax=Carnobacterium gallinarum TaxID=2749 RepID=UPI00054F6916|nr:transcription repressor NadR [Carnobacterium gallinarum]